MPRPKRTPSFVCEVPLRVEPSEAKQLERLFELGRLMYNRHLQEALRRLDLLLKSELYLSAMSALKTWHRERKALLASTPKKQHKRLEKGLKAKRALISAQFAEARKACGFTETDMHRFNTALQRKRCHLGAFSDLDSNTAQKLATRAFKACDAVLTLKRGKPRFKGFRQALGSLEGKDNRSGIRFREEESAETFRSNDGTIRWSGLVLPCEITDGDPYHEHALGAKTKFVRVVRRTIRGKVVWFAQLVCEGKPLQKRPKEIAHGVPVGLDLGPSTLAAVSDEAALLTAFCPELQPDHREVRRLSRRLDRQRRANNPENYGPDGQIKRGRKLIWKTSGKQRKTRAQLAEAHRREAAHRKTLHGRLGNDLLELGTVFRVEKLSMKAWQKRFGRSVHRNAPAMFQNTLKRKAESAGGGWQWIHAGTARLSQRCVCGAIQKKKLSDRWHTCACGVSAQRDLFSAHLALHTDAETHLPCAGPWTPGVECLLSSAHGRGKQQAAIRGLRTSTFGAKLRRQSGSTKDVLAKGNARPSDDGEHPGLGTPAFQG